MAYDAVLIPGDGIGPEVTSAALRVLEAAGAKIHWETHYAGISALEQAGNDCLLPDSTIEAIQRTRLALKGPCTTPIGHGFSSVNVGLRKHLDLYAAIRPVRSVDGVVTRYTDVDVVIIRENTEGLYSGIENQITEGVVTSLKVVTTVAVRRIARFAFEFARSRGRKKVTVFHKANIMKLGDGLFLQTAREVYEDGYEDEVEYEEMIIDAGCMRLVQNPSDFDILLCENLYGDVLSDLCSGFVGGLGVTPGSNFGDIGAVFEAVHGSAPDIAGQGIANPLALIMSGVMMLRHIADVHKDPIYDEIADRIRSAYNGCLTNGEKTADLGGTLSTEAFTDAVIARL
jgi:isocitrate dehydrogenase (NAD+)